MKTPREILLQRHRAAEPKLDGIRQQIVASLTVEEANGEIKRTASPLSPSVAKPFEGGPALSPLRGEGEDRAPWWRDVILSLRWHLAGLSAAWLFVALLSIDHSSQSVAPQRAQRAEPPKQFIAEVRENRRQITQLAESMEIEPPALPQPATPQRRSEAPRQIAFV
jgi:hypothetical protein